MKKILLSILLISLKGSIMAQSCCRIPAGEQFAMLGADKSFVSFHSSPVPFVFIPEKGKMISFKTEDGREGNAFEVKSAKASNNYLFVFHEWWGLNDYIKQEAEKLQAELGDVNVLAIDLYDDKTTNNPEEAGKLMKEVNKDRAEAIISGAMKYTGDKAFIYSIGWCFGGGWSLQSAIMAGDKGKACVMYYGMPETDDKKIEKLHAEVLGIFASKDQWINTKVVSDFQELMKKKGKKLTVKTYEADHAFANPSNPKHDPVATEDAHKRAVSFLKEKLKKS